jgi:AcrR family transcriptional regulator
MTPHKLDRRAHRTRALLQQAHRSLILEKGYEATTVNDICAAANVGRSTFYAHYRGKDDLKRHGLETLRARLTERQQTSAASADPRQRMLGFSLALFEHAREYLDFYRQLGRGRGRQIALSSLRRMLIDLVRKEFDAARRTIAHDPRHELEVQYVVGACLAMLVWWLDGGAKLAPQEVDAIFRRLALDGLARR